jgi:hypothetical protein
LKLHGNVMEYLPSILSKGRIFPILHHYFYPFKYFVSKSFWCLFFNLKLWFHFDLKCMQVCGRFDEKHVSLSNKGMFFNNLNNKIWFHHRLANYFTLIYVFKSFRILWPTCWECVENIELLKKYKSFAILNIEEGLIIEEIGI